MTAQGSAINVNGTYAPAAVVPSSNATGNNGSGWSDE